MRNLLQFAIPQRFHALELNPAKIKFAVYYFDAFISPTPMRWFSVFRATIVYGALLRKGQE